MVRRFQSPFEQAPVRSYRPGHCSALRELPQLMVNKRMIAGLVKNRRNAQKKFNLPLATVFGKAAVHFQAILRECQLRRV